MNLETAIGAMRLICNLGKGGYLEQIGISKGDFERVIGDIPWMANERGRISNALNALIVGSLDAQALPRLNPMPAEYLAAGISLFVSPSNAICACHWLGAAPTTEELSRGKRPNDINRSNYSSPEQIFALVVDLYRSEGRAVCRQQFQRNTGLALEKAEKEGLKNGKTS